MLAVVTVTVVISAAKRMGVDPFELLAALGSALAESVEADVQNIA